MSNSKSKGKSQWADVDGGQAFVIPLTLFKHPNFIRLSPHGVKLMMDLCRQYTGFNNGYLFAGWSVMKDSGWKSRETLSHALLECEHYRLLVRTRQGGKNSPNYHALTWWRIHDKPGRPLMIGPTMAPGNEWKEEQPPFKKPKRSHEQKTLSTTGVSIKHGRRANGGRVNTPAGPTLHD